MNAVNKVAVIGAGVMGAGIAAHIANAGVPVLLLDIVPEGAANRNAVAEGAIERMLKADPAPFMHKRNARLVTPGNIEDHLDQLADCDWIVEAVIERLPIKQDLYRRIDAVRKPGSIVSSNTSTIPLRKLIEGMPASFAADFMITHFFNPPRYMRLLEVVASSRTRGDAVETVRRFADVRLGKSVVDCKDTPGFIANRIGTYWLQCAVTSAVEQGVTVEEADAVVGKPMGIPKTGVFGLLDLVGLDLMPLVRESMAANLPASDPLHAVLGDSTLLEKMISEGYTGRKGKGGFYRINREGGGKAKEAIDLVTGRYRPQRKAQLESVSAARKGGLRALVGHDDKGGRYAWAVLGGTLAYAAALVPEIAEDIAAVDEAMRLGYNWKYGPFELIDQLGTAWFAERLRAEGRPVPALLEMAGERSFYRVEDGRLQVLTVAGEYIDVARPEGVLLLSDIKRCSKPIVRNGSASLWDIGDGVACLEFHTKMNALDAEVMALIRKSISIVKKDYKALVVHNEGSNFSVGANLGLALFAANLAIWSEIENLLEEGQRTYLALRYAPFPVVGAPSGMALGGGCEILLHCDAVQAHAETYMGLVEVGVGIVPAWGGCKEMLRRWSANPKLPRGPMPAVAKAFEFISTAQVAKSAVEAQDMMLFGPNDGVTMNRDRLLADAKALALRLAKDYQPPEPPTFRLPGAGGKAALELAVGGFVKLGKATPHDEVVAAHLADVLTGGGRDVVDTLSEEDVLALERKNFMALVRHPATLARVEHMLMTGKPLRN